MTLPGSQESSTPLRRHSSTTRTRSLLRSAGPVGQLAVDHRTGVSIGHNNETAVTGGAQAREDQA
jgi:hypothetical protein